jgi:ATP-dependent RNA helicase SUPV3L1/SUV3
LRPRDYRKIKRIIFEAVHKFNGVEEVRLSDSQIKQIAGRAGRYGLLGSDEPGGFVTTIHSPDLPILRKAVAAPIKPISNAYLSRPMGGVTDIFSSLPLDSSSLVLHDTYTYVSRMRWPFQFQTNPLTDQMCTFIDTRAGELTLEDKTLLMMAPVPWREADALDVIAQFLHQYRNHMRVHLVECLGDGPLNCLEEVEMSMGHGPPMSSQPTLSALEILHKLLIVYLWMQLRSPVAWCDHVEVNDLKERTERALDWCLQGISWGKQSRQLPDITTLRRKRQANSIVYLGKREIGERREAKWNANTDYKKPRVP